jgi:predicted glycosyltransferase
VVGDIPAHIAPFGPHDVDAFIPWVAERLRQLAPDEIFIDTFPGGLVGELAGLAEIAHSRLTYVGRLLRSAAYFALYPNARSMRFARALLAEPLNADHEADVRHMVEGELASLELRDPDPTHAGALPALPEAFWLVVHSGPAAEVAELLAYACDLQRLENRSAPIVVVSPIPSAEVELGDAHHVDVYPATRLFARAARIVSACGFNIMRQTLAHRDRHSYLPLPRRFDDQFARAARRRALPVRGSGPME